MLASTFGRRTLGHRRRIIPGGFGSFDSAGGGAPDNQSAAAVSLAVTASGAVRTKITVLMTAEEMDQATKKSVYYRPPGR